MVRPAVDDIQGHLGKPQGKNMSVAVPKTKFTQSSLVFKNCTCSLDLCV